MRNIETVGASRPADVVIYAEGTYPFRVGGVSSVIHGIIQSLPGIRFGVVHLHWGDPPAKPGFDKLPNLEWIFPVQVDDFTTASRKLRGMEFPRGTVHHAHTCGLAGLAAAVARRQQPGSRMILSEHSLYVRDVLAQLEGRDNGWTPMPGSNEMPPLPLCRSPADCAPHVDFTGLRSVITTTAREVYECADTVTYLDRDLLEEAIAFGLDPARATIVPNAIDVDEFRTIQRKMDPERVWHIAIIGRIVPVKGIMEGIECAGWLRHSGLDHRMSIIGPDDEVPFYAAACRRKVPDLGLEDVVHFKGTIRAKEALRDIDLLLLPSHKEAMPMVVLEAMAAGVPVVANDTGNVAGILGNDIKDEAGVVTGLATMGHSIMNLLADESRYQSMRENGPRRAARDYDIKTRAIDWRQIYST